MKKVYQEKTVNYSLVYLKDTDENRRKLTMLYGGADIADLWDYAYIEFNTKTKKWRTTFTFEWLYKNEPDLTTIDEIQKVTRS